MKEKFRDTKLSSDSIKQNKEKYEKAIVDIKSTQMA